eukprot:g25616.t1
MLKKLIRVFPNHKPWMNQEAYSLLKTRCAAFKTGDPDQYRKFRYDLCKAISAKRQYQTKLEVQIYQTDSRSLRQGLNDIMGFKIKQHKVVDKDTSLPDKLNAFYARFAQRLAFLGVNPRKLTGQNGIPGCTLRSCADQQAEVFTDIFSFSLRQAEVPTCFKKTAIIPLHCLQLDPQLSDPQTTISED